MNNPLDLSLEKACVGTLQITLLELDKLRDLLDHYRYFFQMQGLPVPNEMQALYEKSTILLNDLLADRDRKREILRRADKL